MDERDIEKLPRLSWMELEKTLKEKKPFEAITPMGTALIRVKRFEPLVGLAVHAGHRVREELLSIMAISEEERQYEEDSGVDEFIADFPIQMIALDSRYEYDLNRASAQAIYLKPFQSWGKKVWLTPPSKEELQISQQKWDEFHDFLACLTDGIAEQFGRTLIMDVHSYNYRRANLLGRGESLPTFNLATSDHDQKTHRKTLDFVTKELGKVSIPAVPSIVKENAVFKKDGAVAMALQPKHADSLILPVEVKKIYMDERTGEIDKKTVAILRKALGEIGEKTVAQLRA